MGHNKDAQSQVINNAGSVAKFNGDLEVNGSLKVNGPEYHDGAVVPTKVSISLAASATTDGMDITFQLTDEDGTSVTGGYLFDWWISESSDGSGLTGDSYSGDVTTVTGTEIAEHVSKKAFTALTATGGNVVALAVDSANPTDQYVVAQLGNRRFVSAASGANWEGA